MISGRSSINVRESERVRSGVLLALHVENTLSSCKAVLWCNTLMLHSTHTNSSDSETIWPLWFPCWWHTQYHLLSVVLPHLHGRMLTLSSFQNDYPKLNINQPGKNFIWSTEWPTLSSTISFSMDNINPLAISHQYFDILHLAVFLFRLKCHLHLHKSYTFSITIRCDSPASRHN